MTEIKKKNFEENYAKNRLSSKTRLHDDGSKTLYASYSAYVNPTQFDSIRAFASFMVTALGEGYTEASDRVVFQHEAKSVRIGDKLMEEPFHHVVFFFEKKITPEAPKTPASRADEV